MAYHNAWLSAEGYGNREATITAIDYGLDITAGSDQAKNYTVFYPKYTSRGSVAVKFEFRGWTAYNDFAQWIAAYGRKLSLPRNTIGPMRVMCFPMGFDISAVPASGLGFGDEVGKAKYELLITFEGASSAEDFENPLVSKFRRATVNASDSIYFYPGGIQLGGDDGIDPLYRGLHGAYYDLNPPPDPADYDPED